jgi:hypothetical protein
VQYLVEPNAFLSQALDVRGERYLAPCSIIGLLGGSPSQAETLHEFCWLAFLKPDRYKPPTTV